MTKKQLKAELVIARDEIAELQGAIDSLQDQVAEMSKKLDVSYTCAGNAIDGGNKLRHQLGLSYTKEPIDLLTRGSVRPMFLWFLFKRKDE